VDVFIGSGRSCLLMPWFATAVVTSSPLAPASLVEPSLWQDEQLLDREDDFDSGEEGRETARVVLVREVGVAALELEFMDAVVERESTEAEVRVGLLSGKVNRFEVPGPADMGLISVGESLERKSR
jgi:hypothetical protein